MSFYTHDNTVDSPINNFATLNPLIGSEGTYSNGNTKINATNTKRHFGTISCPVGMISYFEVVPASTTKREVVGFGTISQDYWLRYYNWQSNDTRLIHEAGIGYIGSHLNADITGDIVGLALDLTGQYTNIKMYVNGNLLTDQTTTTLVESVSSMFPMVYSASGTFAFLINFGQDHTFGGTKTGGGAYNDANGIGQFYYEPPEGALALCTANIPSGPIDIANDDVPEDYFKAVTYTGQTVGGAMTSWNGTTGTVDVGFQPDLIWIKRRGPSSGGHNIFDNVRGANQRLETHNSGSQYYEVVMDFDPQGFTVRNNGLNTINENYVTWCWKAAGSPADNEARIIDTDGSLITKTTADLKTETGASITPSKVSANRKSGFSIIRTLGKPTGAVSFPHGLTKTPELLIGKATNQGWGWSSYHISVGNNAYIQLNTATVPVASSGIFNHDANLIRISAAFSSADYIWYAWHSVSGYSKFGSYVGNGSTTGDGPYVELGFRPAWLMVKEFTQSGNHWGIFDSARDPYNGVGRYLYANLSSEEDNYSSSYPIDFLSNGFKIKTHIGAVNNPNQTYLFAAFAEAPFNAPATAR